MTAPQLLNMRLSGFADNDIEIVVPRLRFFSLEYPWPWDVLGFPNFYLPYVDRAQVFVYDKAFGKKSFDHHLNKLVQF